MIAESTANKILNMKQALEDLSDQLINLQEDTKIEIKLADASEYEKGLYDIENKFLQSQQKIEKIANEALEHMADARLLLANGKINSDQFNGIIEFYSNVVKEAEKAARGIFNIDKIRVNQYDKITSKNLIKSTQDTNNRIKGLYTELESDWNDSLVSMNMNTRQSFAEKNDIIDASIEDIKDKMKSFGADPTVMAAYKNSVMALLKEKQVLNKLEQKERKQNEMIAIRDTQDFQRKIFSLNNNNNWAQARLNEELTKQYLEELKKRKEGTVEYNKEVAAATQESMSAISDSSSAMNSAIGSGIEQVVGDLTKIAHALAKTKSDEELVDIIGNFYGNITGAMSSASEGDVMGMISGLISTITDLAETFKDMKAEQERLAEESRQARIVEIESMYELNTATKMLYERFYEYARKVLGLASSVENQEITLKESLQGVKDAFAGLYFEQVKATKGAKPLNDKELNSGIDSVIKNFIPLLDDLAVGSNGTTFTRNGDQSKILREYANGQKDIGDLMRTLIVVSKEYGIGGSRMHGSEGSFQRGQVEKYLKGIGLESLFDEKLGTIDSELGSILSSLAPIFSNLSATNESSYADMELALSQYIAQALRLAPIVEDLDNSVNGMFASGGVTENSIMEGMKNLQVSWLKGARRDDENTSIFAGRVNEPFTDNPTFRSAMDSLSEKGDELSDSEISEIFKNIPVDDWLKVAEDLYDYQIKNAVSKGDIENAAKDLTDSYNFANKYLGNQLSRDSRIGLAGKLSDLPDRLKTDLENFDNKNKPETSDISDAGDNIEQSATKIVEAYNLGAIKYEEAMALFDKLIGEVSLLPGDMQEKLYAAIRDARIDVTKSSAEKKSDASSLLDNTLSNKERYLEDLADIEKATNELVSDWEGLISERNKLLDDFNKESKSLVEDSENRVDSLEAEKSAILGSFNFNETQNLRSQRFAKAGEVDRKINEERVKLVNDLINLEEKLKESLLGIDDQLAKLETEYGSISEAYTAFADKRQKVEDEYKESLLKTIELLKELGYTIDTTVNDSVDSLYLNLTDGITKFIGSLSDIDSALDNLMARKINDIRRELGLRELAPVRKMPEFVPPVIAPPASQTRSVPIINIPTMVAPQESPTRAMPEFVPPVIAAASGFEGLINKPTRFLVGEGGQPEFVSVKPIKSLSDMGSSMSSPMQTIIHIHDNIDLRGAYGISSPQVAQKVWNQVWAPARRNSINRITDLRGKVQR